jgi:nicotinamidase-related amidase
MLKLENTVLVIIDMQGKLWNVMNEKEALLENCLKLIKGLQILGVPIVITEQNPKGLGPTLPEITQLIPEAKAIPKFTFSCCQDSGFMQAMNDLKRKQILICGIEAHICVYQTTLELLSKGYEVQVVADVVSSRVLKNKDISLSRLQSEGAKLTITEMAQYELLQTAENPKFKEMLRVVK